MKFLTGGSLIKDIRIKLGVTQNELGMKKINHNTISMIETGTCDLSYKLALRLSENINEIAFSKGLDIKTNANLLLEPAEVKCEKWCKEELNKIAFIANSDAKINKYKEIFSVAELYKIKDSLLEAVKQLGETYYQAAKYSEASECFQQCAKMYEHKSDLYNLADTYNYIGMCLYYSDLEESYKYHYKALETISKMLESDQDSLLKIKIIYYIALYHARTESFSQAEEYLKSIKGLRCTDDDLAVKLLILEGNIKLSCQRYDEASEILKGLLNLKDELIASYKHMIYNNLGICLEKQGNVAESIDLLEKAIKVQLDKSTPNLTNSLVYSTKLQLKCSKYDVALRYVEGALTNALKHHQLGYVVECYKLSYIIYKKKNLIDKCMDTKYVLKKFLSDNNYIDKSNTYNLMELDYLLQTNDINNAKALLNNMLIGREEF